MSQTEQHPNTWVRDAPTSAPPVQEAPNRKRSNSQSQVIAPLMSLYPQNSGLAGASSARRAAAKDHKPQPQKRHQAEYYVTLTPLNDTFVKKHIHVPYYPETCKLGRPTGTKVKPYVTNGYFDSRVLSRNHACMYIEPKSGQLMIQDMGSSNGTFVNLEKIAADAVPINIGDIVNLGFNIQVETSHKQISARIENINVVSNNPKGSVLSVLPQLSPEIINNFSVSEMKHFDFIQSIFSLVLGIKEIEETTSVELEFPASKFLKSFENAMFADVLPSMDDLFNATTDPNNNAGIFTNSRIINSNDLESTLEVLTVNLAKVKQQNATLKTLESFLNNYLTRVNDLNRSYLKAETGKVDEKFEQGLKVEREKLHKMAEEHRRSTDQHREMVQSLEGEVNKLKADKIELTNKLEEHNKLKWVISSDNDLHFGNDPLDHDSTRSRGTSSSKRDTIDIASFDFGSGKSLKDISPDASEEVEEISNSSDVESEERENEIGHHLQPHAPKQENPYNSYIQLHLADYKNQGVVLGFFVVVAGFLYQNSTR